MTDEKHTIYLVHLGKIGIGQVGAFPLAALYAAATACGWTVARTMGTSRDQVTMRIVRDAARAGVINVVLVLSFECLTRNPREFARLQDDLATAGCVIVVAAQTRAIPDEREVGSA